MYPVGLGSNTKVFPKAFCWKRLGQAGASARKVFSDAISLRQLLELEPISSSRANPALTRSNASFDSHCSSMSDKRVDPTTGAAVTYKELVATYKKQYKRQEIEDQGGLNVR